MPKCSNCDVKQGRLNEGNLCKSCFDNRNKTLNSDAANKHINIPQMDINSLDRNMINFLKTNMEHEQKRELELTALLRDHIEYLKNDIEFLRKELSSKDKIIDLLLKDNYIDNNVYDNENNNDDDDDLFIYPKRSTRVDYGANEDNGDKPIELYNRFNLLSTSPSNGDKINDYGSDHEICDDDISHY